MGKEVQSPRTELAGDGDVLNSYDEDEAGGRANRHSEVQ